MGEKKRILIVDDDTEIRDLLEFDISSSGYFVDTASNGMEGLNKALNNKYDLILLDVMMPKMNGYDVCKNIRLVKPKVPILMLTAKGTIHDKTEGFDVGADDYLVKPFEFGELMARIRCLLRRPQNLESLNQINVGDVIYSQETNALTGTAGSCTLSQKEGQLLELFLRNPNQILQRNTILSRIWGADYEIEDGNLDNYIYFIRRRLKNVGSTLHIKTIRGVGYRLETEE